MSFGFSVGDIILVAQLSWRTWQACTSGRKAAPGEFIAVEQELAILSQALETLAKTLSSTNPDDGSPNPRQEELQSLEGPIGQCRETLEDLDKFLEKNRHVQRQTPQGQLQWTQRARANWRRVVWTTQKDQVAGFRDRISRHLQYLNSSIMIFQQGTSIRMEKHMEQLTLHVAGAAIDMGTTVRSKAANAVAALADGSSPTDETAQAASTSTRCVVVNVWLACVVVLKHNKSLGFSDHERLTKGVSMADYLASHVDLRVSTESAEQDVRLVSCAESIRNVAGIDYIARTMLAIISVARRFKPGGNELDFLVAACSAMSSQSSGNSDKNGDVSEEAVVSQIHNYIRSMAVLLEAISALINRWRRETLRIYPVDFYQQDVLDIVQGAEQIITKRIQSVSSGCSLTSSEIHCLTEVSQAQDKLTGYMSKSWDQKPADFTDALVKMRKWLDPPEEVDADRARQSTRKWPQTCNWIFQKKSYQDWFREPKSAILWLYARPGAGKSVLSSHMVNLFEEAGEMVAYYCFRYNDDVLRDPKSLLLSVAFQLCEHQPVACHTLKSIMEEGFSLLNTNVGVIWRKLFVNCLLTLPFGKPVYWIIDALDECDPTDRILFLGFLADISSSLHNIKVVIISRYLRDIASKLQQIPVPVEEIVPDDNAADVSLFVKERVERSPLLSVLQEKIQVTLEAGANGSFLWTSRVLETLDECDSLQDITQTLTRLPSGMDALYSRILSDMCSNTLTQRKLARSILCWTICTLRPLDTSELTFALEIEHGTLLDIKTSIRNVCGQLVGVDRGGKVQANHMTVQEYLTSENLDSEFAVPPEKTHGTIAKKCLEELETFAKYANFSFDSQITEDNPLAQYVAEFWSHHVVKAGGHSELIEGVIDFLQSDNVSGWLQTLALFKGLRYVAETVANLESLPNFKRSGPNGLLDRINNLSRQLGYQESPYSGPLINGQRNGFGVCNYADGSIYEGMWENDLRHGFGECVFHDGRQYTGRWSRDEFHGQGTLTTADGMYVGEFVDGRKEGFGEMHWTWMERFRYQGQWQNDRPHGTGTMIYCWGTRYEGDWRYGCEHGHGTVVYWNGNTYTGPFEDGEELGDVEVRAPTLVSKTEVPEGSSTYQATLSYRSGAKYVGAIDDEGFPSGHGVLDAPTGVKWEGEFLDGRFHGAGVSTRAGGGTMKGVWHQQGANGVFEDVNDQKDGGRYYGELHDSTRHGFGRQESARGYVYEGGFRKNEMHGEGKRMYANGDVFEGSSAHGAMQGPGTMRYASGACYEGEWQNDRKHGKGRLTTEEGYVVDGVWSSDIAVSGHFITFPDPQQKAD